jgi:hypothetical protein
LNNRFIVSAEFIFLLLPLRFLTQVGAAGHHQAVTAVSVWHTGIGLLPYLPGHFVVRQSGEKSCPFPPEGKPPHAVRMAIPAKPC